MQKQFRPPIKKVVIEIPAGLVDAGEGAAESAVRELKEETGYVGTVTEDVGVVMFNGGSSWRVDFHEVLTRVDANEYFSPIRNESQFTIPAHHILSYIGLLRPYVKSR